MDTTNNHSVDGSEPTFKKPQEEATSEAMPEWTWPTRMCRICYEEVVPTITMYPPGLPPHFQRPHVEYKNDDEYGRLMKPCRCRGGLRYIHELCLLRSRTETQRAGSMWKCHECGHKFNFKRLTLQRYLGSWFSSAALTVVVMVIFMFLLGFVADPIINLYADPYDTIVGHQSAWSEIDIRDADDDFTGWSLHFLKGMISMGLVGFLKTALMNPFQWWNLRGTGWISGRSGMSNANTGRERAVNISWIAVIVGISSAFYFFYQWVQTIIQRTLQRIGNNIVDTQLPGDDDDLKPPPGWKPPNTESKQSEEDNLTCSDGDQKHNGNESSRSSRSDQTSTGDNTSYPTVDELDEETVLVGGWSGSSTGTAYSSALKDARDQGTSWSFAGI